LCWASDHVVISAGVRTGRKPGDFHRIGARPELLPHARKVAQAFNGLPPGAVRDSKKLLQQAQGAVIREAILREASHFGPRLAGGEAREAIAAILEKRPPDFSKFE